MSADDVPGPTVATGVRGSRARRAPSGVDTAGVTDTSTEPGTPLTDEVAGTTVTAVESTAVRDRLLELIRRDAVVRGRVTLSSGLEADSYLDLRRITLSGLAAPMVGQVVLDLVADLLADPGVDAVGGLTMGADPVATAVLHAAAARGMDPVDAFVVRKAAKSHGLQRQIEGPDIAGRRVLVVEDTATTGGSPLAAAEAARAAGAEVVAIVTIADRATGAAEAFSAAGLAYRYVYGLDELGL